MAGGSITVGTGITPPGNLAAGLDLDTQSFNAAFGVDVSTGTITFASPQDFRTGDALVYHDNGGTPVGTAKDAKGDVTQTLLDGQTYYVIVVNSTQIKLADSLADAMDYSATDNTAIPLVSTGTGTQSLVKTTVDLGVAQVTVPVAVTSQIVAVTLGAAGGATIDVAGSVSVNFVRDSDLAAIEDSNATNGKIVQAGGTVTVTAVDSSKIDAGAGAVSLGLGDDGLAVSVGLSTAYNNIANSVQAEIDDSIVSGTGSYADDIQGVVVSAQSDASIVGVTIAGSGSLGTDGGLGFTGAGAVSVNTIGNTAESEIGGDSEVTSLSGGVSVTAMDSSSIKAIAGALAFGLTLGDGGVGIAIGAGVAVNTVNDTASALIDDSSVGSASAVDVSGSSSATILALSFGVAGAATGGSAAGVSFAGAGSGSGNTITDTVSAEIEDESGVSADNGDVDVAATDSPTITAGAGAAALALAFGETGVSVSVGVSATSNSITDAVTAQVSASTVVAAGNVDLTATSTGAAIGSYTFAGSVAVGVGVYSGFGVTGAGAGSGNTITDTIEASIVAGSVVQALGIGSVVLTATDGAAITADAGGVALGLAGGSLGVGVGISLGAAAAVNTITNAIKAIIDDSNVSAANGVDLTAQTTGTIKALTFGIAGSVSGALGAGVSVAGAGSASSNTITNTVEALIQDRSEVTAGSVQLAATAGATIDATAGGVAVGAGFGIGGGAAISVGLSVSSNEIGGPARPPAIRSRPRSTPRA